MSFLEKKRILIVGLASNRSIAAGIAKAMAKQGAELIFTYQNDKLKTRVEKMAAEWNALNIYPCDVNDDQQIEDLFAHIGKDHQHLDGIVHSVAYAPPDQLEGDYLSQVTRSGFLTAHETSSYSFAALAKAGLPLMEGRAAALLTLSYLGSQRAIPNYNVMGLAKASLEANIRYMALSLGPKNIRVNGISAGPIRTLASAGINNFRKMLEHHEEVAPLRRNVSIDAVGNTAAFLCSDLAADITSELIYVDGGYHNVGISA
jgi:enoyl-[acyl-carrier protein] reductase I